MNIEVGQRQRLDLGAVMDIMNESSYCIEQINKKADNAIRKDAVEYLSAGFVNNLLTQYDPEVIRTKFPGTPLSNGEAIKVNTGKVAQWAERVVYQRIDPVGRFGRIHPETRTLNPLGFRTGSFTYNTAFYGAAVNISFADQMRAGAPNAVYDIKAEKLAAIDTVYSLTMEDLIAVGDTGIPGLLNHFDCTKLYLPYRLDNQSYSGGSFSTDQQKYDGLKFGRRMFIETLGTFKPNLMIAQHQVNDDVNSDRIGSTNDTMSVWSKFSTSYGLQKDIVVAPQCIGAGRLGTDVVAFVNNDPTVVEAHMTLPLMILPLQPHGLGFSGYAVFGYAGVHIKQAAGVLLLEMPAPDAAYGPLN